MEHYFHAPICVVVCMCGFFNVCMCVCVGFVMCGCGFCNVWLCVYVGVLVICVLVFTVFCIVCTVCFYCFFYVYLFLLVFSVLDNNYCHRVTTIC
jgi:hypothetical protein